MKKTVWGMVILASMVAVCGCDTLRFAPKEEQKQNAYLHWRGAGFAAGLAEQEQTSPTLQGLTELAAQQSGAFVADYGLPKELPAADNAAAILDGAGAAVASAATQQSFERPDVWQVADGAMEFGLALAGLIGGVYGVRATQFLQQAREKSKALKEIIEGNELFKQANPDSAAAFKDAQKGQSTETRKIVAEEKQL
jgi:hypothetical protein